MSFSTSWKNKPQMKPGHLLRRALAGPLAVLLVAGSLLVPSTPVAAADGENAVGGAWLGLGYNQDPLYRGADDGTPDEEWDDIQFAEMAKRTAFIRPGLVRIMIKQSWFNPGGIVGVYDWQTNEIENVFRLLDHYKQLGTKVVTGMWGTPSKSFYRSRDSAKMQADLMREFDRRGYTHVERYNGINEPNNDKGLKYPDWVTATTNLRAEFAAAGLRADLIGGPDTAQAGISAHEGDLGLMSVADEEANTEQSLVWRVDQDLTSFSARFYRTAETVDGGWTFQASMDNIRWKDLAVRETAPAKTHAAADWYRVDVTSRGIPEKTRFLRLTMPAKPGVERAVSTVTLTTVTPETSYTDPMNDRTRTVSSTSGWAYPGGALYGDWWLQASLDKLVAQQEAHFYVHEVDLKSPPEYPEATLTEAVRQLKQADGDGSVILGETGMKAPGGIIKDYSFARQYEQGVRMADLAVQEARAGVNGAMSWCLDGFAKDNDCGMWDHFKPVTKDNVRPWFYTWSLLCRYLPAGSQIFAPPQPAGVRVLKAKLPGGWTFVLVNRGTSPARVSITAKTGEIKLHKYVYTKEKAPVDAAGLPTPDEHFSATFDNGRELVVAAEGVAVFTTES